MEDWAMKKASVFAIFDDSGAQWEEIVDGIIAESRHVVVLHGAGSYNGISIADANRLVNDELIPRIEAYLRDGGVSVIYDGDDDDPNYPDIGHIMGRLRDHFAESVDWYAVQMQSWYKYGNELPALRPLHSTNGGQYNTVVFPDNKFLGNHDHFSQHSRLVCAPSYEQWYIGACGQIASGQLADYSIKVIGAPGTHKAVVFRAPVSEEQGQSIRQKLEEGGDPARTKRLQDAQTRRTENSYGMLCTPSGDFIFKSEYHRIQIEVV